MDIHGINICSIPAGLSTKRYIGGPRLDGPWHAGAVMAQTFGVAVVETAEHVTP